MFNATELILTPKAMLDDGTGLRYIGPLTEVVIWRDERSNKMQHAQPGEFVVCDRDGYPRRYAAEDFEVLFEPAPVPQEVTHAEVRTQRVDALTLSWDDPGDGHEGVRIYLGDELLADLPPEMDDWTLAGFDPNTVYHFVLKRVNSYGQESEGIALLTATRPIAVSNVAGRALAATAIELTFDAHDLPVRVLRQTGGEGPWTKVASLPAGSVFANDTGLDPETSYRYAVQAIGALDTASEADPITLTTSA